MKRKRLAVALGVLLFSGCSRNPSPADITKAVTAVAPLTRQSCGATWSLEKGNQASSGQYVTGAFPEDGEKMLGFPDEPRLRGFVAHHRDLFSRSENVLGTWCVTPQGDCHAPGAVTCYLDISRETATLDDAARLAAACNQISIAHLKRDGSVEIIDSYAGHHFGDGKPISGTALDACRMARGE